MVRNKELKTLPACKRCGYVPGFEHIEVHTMYGPWEGWIIECGCLDRDIKRGNAEAAIKEWSEKNEGRNKNNDNRRRSA